MMTRDGAGSRAEEGPAVVVVRVRSARDMVSPPGAARAGLFAGPSPAVPNIPRPELQVPCRIAAGRPILGGGSPSRQHPVAPWGRDSSILHPAGPPRAGSSAWKGPALAI